MEETDPRYTRRLRSRLSTENVLTSSTLQVNTLSTIERQLLLSKRNDSKHSFLTRQSIKEEERKKNKVADTAGPGSHDELTIYLRQPYGDSQPTGPRRLSKLKRGVDEEKIDKIEIDSDNIETPPATRKLFSPSKEVKPVEKEPCKRERCSSSFQNRDFKHPTPKNASNNADFGIGECSTESISSPLLPTVIVCSSLCFR